MNQLISNIPEISLKLASEPGWVSTRYTTPPVPTQLSPPRVHLPLPVRCAKRAVRLRVQVKHVVGL